MKDLPRNFGSFLIGLGARPTAQHDGLPCPAYISEVQPIASSAMIETKKEVAAHIDHNKGVAGRAFPGRSIGARIV